MESLERFGMELSKRTLFHGLQGIHHHPRSYVAAETQMFRQRGCQNATRCESVTVTGFIGLATGQIPVSHARPNLIWRSGAMVNRPLLPVRTAESCCCCQYARVVHVARMFPEAVLRISQSEPKV